MSRERSLWTRLAMLFAVCLMGVVGLAAPASADSAAGGDDHKVSWSDAKGGTNEARALSLREVKERGLARYVDAERYTETTPKLFTDTSRASSPAEQREGRTSELATTCWEHWYSYGTSALRGQTDVTWCGDGTWVRYSASGCWGEEHWPTYQYLGCTVIDDYGHPRPDEYWNIYNVWTQWDLCPAWVPVWAECSWHDRPWGKYQYQGDGDIVRLGGTD